MSETPKEAPEANPPPSSRDLKALFYDLQVEQEMISEKLKRVNAAIAEALQRESKAEKDKDGS